MAYLAVDKDGTEMISDYSLYGNKTDDSPRELAMYSREWSCYF